LGLCKDFAKLQKLRQQHERKKASARPGDGGGTFANVEPPRKKPKRPDKPQPGATIASPPSSGVALPPVAGPIVGPEPLDPGGQESGDDDDGQPGAASIVDPGTKAHGDDSDSGSSSISSSSSSSSSEPASGGDKDKPKTPKPASAPVATADTTSETAADRLRPARVDPDAKSISLFGSDAWLHTLLPPNALARRISLKQDTNENRYKAVFAHAEAEATKLVGVFKQSQCSRAYVQNRDHKKALANVLDYIWGKSLILDGLERPPDSEIERIVQHAGFKHSVDIPINTSYRSDLDSRRASAS
jgi:hypothetical protein